MKRSTLVLKTLSVMTLAGFFMSSTKCQKEVVEGRQLKKNVRIGDVSATTYLDNSGFSFSEVARNQITAVLFDRNDFYERNIYPTPDEMASVTNQSLSTNQKLSSVVATKTVAQLKTWFPMAKSQNIALNRDSSCFMTRPQHFIYGTINSLETYSGTSLNLGLSNTGVANVLPISANLKFDKMRLDLSFKAVDPWTQQTVAAVNDEAFKKDYKVGFGIDLGIIHIGPEFYRTTGLAEVLLNGLKSATQKLAAAILQEPRQIWNTRVVYSGDSYVAILGGAELGLKAGDKLKVFNETHTWNGEACGDSSVLTGSMIVSDVSDPWIIEVEEAGDLLTRAKVLNPKETETIAVGALVQLSSFVAPVVTSKTAAK